MTPTLEMILLAWLSFFYKNLPKLVMQKYGTQLRTRTLASLREEISSLWTFSWKKQELVGKLELVGMPPSCIQLPIVSPETTSTANSTPHIGIHLGKSHDPEVSAYFVKRLAARINTFSVSANFYPTQTISTWWITHILDDANADEHDLSDEDYEVDNTPIGLRVKIRQSPYLDTYKDHPVTLFFTVKQLAIW